MTDYGSYELHLGDVLEWIPRLAPNSVHAVVSEPPFGLVEYTPKQVD